MAFFGIENPNSKAGGAWRDPGKIRLVCFHVAVTDPTPHSALNVATWQANQRQVASGYHSLFDSSEHLRYYPDDRIAHGSRHINGHAVHLSFACHTSTWHTDPGWANKALAHAAAEVRRLHEDYRLPYRLLNRAEALSGVRGFTMHSTVDPGRRSDPGAFFPVDQLFSMANSIGKPVTTDEEAVMKFGEIGGEVQMLQRDLNRLFGMDLVDDGVFGPLTEAAVVEAQKRWGYIQSGQPDAAFLTRLLRELLKVAA